MDTPVSPVGVLVGEADDQTPEYGVDRWASAFGRGRLGPVPCDESTMPSKHRLRSENQERRRSPRAIHRAAQEGKDRAVGFVESRPVDLALQHEDLVSERKDLSIARVAGGEYPADSSENNPCERGKQVHNSSTIPISKVTRNPLNRWTDDFSAPSARFQPTPGNAALRSSTPGKSTHSRLRALKQAAGSMISVSVSAVVLSATSFHCGRTTSHKERDTPCRPCPLHWPL